MSQDLRNVSDAAIRGENADAKSNLMTSNFAQSGNGVCAVDPLESAVMANNMQVVQLLLENGAIVGNHSECPFRTLLGAVRTGNEAMLKMLLARTADLEAKDRYGLTALHVAAMMGHLRFSEILLNHGANINALSSWTASKQYTPLYLATANNHAEIVEMLLTKGVDVNAGGMDDVKPVYVATELRREKIVRLLLECGADVNASDKEGTTILNVAVKHNMSEIVEHIVEFRPDLDNRSNKRALNIAITNGVEPKIVEALLKYGFTVDRDEVVVVMKLLEAAVTNGLLMVVEDLLNSGADVNATHECFNGRRVVKWTLLHIAARTGRADMARLLINNGANVNAVVGRERTPISYAVENNDATLTKILLDNGATVDNGVLNIAVMEGNCAIVEMLMQPNIDINAQDNRYRTTLHYAGALGGYRWNKGLLDDAAKEKYKSDKAEIAELLLQRGASPNIIDRDGENVLCAAIGNDNMKLVKVLLRHNANVRIEQEGGLTALHASMYAQNEALAKVLLNRGADINAVSMDGITALYIACEKGNEKLVEMLLKRGARTDRTLKRKDENGTPRGMQDLLNVAVTHRHYKVVELLLENGLEVDSPHVLCTAVRTGDFELFRLLIEHGSDVTAGFPAYGFLLHAATACIYSGNNDGHRGWKEIVKYLEERIVKIKVARLNADIVQFYFGEKYNELENDCERELYVMISENIGNSTVSYYDVLSKDIDRVTKWAGNQDIVKALESRQLEERFPRYNRLIRENFKKGQRRNFLISSSSRLMNTSLGYKLPDIVTDAIFGYLNNAGLIHFLNAPENSH